MRHKSVETVALYLGDSNTLATFRDRHNNEDKLNNRVGPYHSIYVKDPEQLESMYMAYDVSLGSKTMYEVGGCFLFQNVGIKEDLFQNVGINKEEFENANLNIYDMVQKITEYKVVSSIPQVEDLSQQIIIDNIHKYVPPQLADHMTASMESHTNKRDFDSMNNHLKLISDRASHAYPLQKTSTKQTSKKKLRKEINQKK